MACLCHVGAGEGLSHQLSPIIHILEWAGVQGFREEPEHPEFTCTKVMKVSIPLPPRPPFCGPFDHSKMFLMKRL